MRTFLDVRKPAWQGQGGGYVGDPASFLLVGERDITTFLIVWF